MFINYLFDKYLLCSCYILVIGLIIHCAINRSDYLTYTPLSPRVPSHIFMSLTHFLNGCNNTYIS